MKEPLPLETRYKEALKFLPRICDYCNKLENHDLCEYCCFSHEPYSYEYPGHSVHDLFLPYFEYGDGRENKWEI